ncbi:MAG: MBOAT family protein [Clostridium sp.]|nr:MBOAT family protein [Clostridium sp.]
MVFSSFEFMFRFLPAFLAVYFIAPDSWKNVCLFAGSLVFYFYGVKDTPLFLGLLGSSVLVNFRIGALIGRRRKSPVRKRWLICGVIYNLFWLGLFKYAGFLAWNLNLLLEKAGIAGAVPVYESVLPVGISFYTFQSVSYLLDVYRRETAYEKSFVGFGMYISMFPQLIAGPIVTYSSICRQIEGREHSFSKAERGLREFTIGLGLKVILANRLGGLWNQVGAIGYESISTPLAWLGLAAFSLQIYFDFYGYSLMAKGLGLLMGFELPDNFRHPYMAVSMTEFWRRWHITLGSWFREYVYIPLGGNRGGSLRTLRNMFIVWFLTGFWHGASWNFILWGLVLFVIIGAEKLGYIRILEERPIAGHIYMLFMIPLTWLLFAVTDFGRIGIYLQRLFPFLAAPGRYSYYGGDFLKYGKLYGLSLAAGLIFMTDIPRKLYEKYRDTPATALLLLGVFWFCVYCMKIGLDDPFLYFRF